MPLVGVIDPSHKEQSLQRQGKLPKWLTLDEVYQKAQELSSKYSNWPFELVNTAVNRYMLPHEEHSGTRVSVTALTSGCPRGSILERKVDYVMPLDGMWAALRGTMMHKVLEEFARPGSIAEARFYTTVDGVTIAGGPDLVTVDTVYDYKNTENPPSFGYPYRHHTEQVMYYAWLLRHAEDWKLAEGDGPLPFDPRENPVTKAVVVYLSPKGPKPILVERKEVFLTPKGVEREGKRPYIWTDKEVLEGNRGDTGLRVRLDAFVRGMEAYPRWPKGVEDVWGGKPGWTCPGPPLCYLPNCLAKRDSDMFVWKNPA